MLSRLALMVQAAFLDGQCLDHFSPFDDGCVAPEVNVGRRDVGEALVVAMVVVMIDEGADLHFQIARQVVVLQQDPVLECLMPALDLALRLRMVWRTPDVVHALVFKPVSQIAGDIRRPVIAEQPRFVDDIGAVAS